MKFSKKRSARPENSTLVHDNMRHVDKGMPCVSRLVIYMPRKPVACSPMTGDRKHKATATKTKRMCCITMMRPIGSVGKREAAHQDAIERTA